MTTTELARPGRTEPVAPLGRAPRPVKTSTVVLTAVAVLVGVGFVLPAIWILIGSFRPNAEILTTMSPLSRHLVIPSEVTLENYVHLLVDSGFARALLNSFIVCIASVAIGLAMSAMAAYALAVYQFPGRNLIFAVIVISFMVPFEAIAIPLAQQFTDWGLGNTMIGLILPGVANGLAIFNLRQYFLGIPQSYREAAMLDGASEPRILFSLYARLSGPALTNSALLIFLGQWTAFLWPLLIVSDSDLQLAPVALAGTFGEHAADYGQNFAGTIVLTLVPAISMFVLQRFFGRLSIGSGEK
ncbi:carbohydrate ABC transporter permease [Paractinoplanes brasiliensis]|uniref:Carbohydrate ABC transporter membrane protein 2 (CUT1 family) n=1 Tax=Paractinoplanes brasiliensis TaxID=52695 RepID=A0A4R6JBF7_9ACTN|nr:carbohydrate ABC transporter permease [Actinoplanes brasiliensis]TDO32862.1 carbohydrate ABC transporter membrane protein 2 (CUT1 family) [Actinoplanes brasiliensis]GID31593.1 sn-glycerol-3-phosphate transport system permease protein UgpE [Actinoplanes brasiliensis]